jgi:thioredoxin reductase
MFILGAFVLGYWMGTRAGENGMSTLIEAGQKVLASEEFQTTVAGVMGMARGAIGQILAGAQSDERGGGLRVA